MTYRDQGWHDNNEEARAQEEWEYNHPPCPTCADGYLPDRHADACLDCLQGEARQDWLERRVA
jgi:hypothetical protein